MFDSQTPRHDHIFHFQSNYRVQLEPDGPWLAAQAEYEAAGLKPGQVKHWTLVAFTEVHQLPDLTMTVHWETGCDEPVGLISNLTPQQQPHLIYEKRYWVETLFGNCKSRGFQLARTHMYAIMLLEHCNSHPTEAYQSRLSKVGSKS